MTLPFCVWQECADGVSCYVFRQGSKSGKRVGATVRLKVVPGDFCVEEQADLALVARGPWAVYRVRKVGLTTLEVQARLASRLNLPARQVVFPALKDKEAIAVQFAALPAECPAVIEEERFRAERVGFRQEPLRPADLRGNAFALLVRDLAREEADQMARRLEELGRHGQPNYFDEQRFGSFAADGSHVGKAIIRRDAQGALRAYLPQPFVGDPRPTVAFRRMAAALWPDWPAMFQAAPRPSNYRSVLTYLIGHPEDYRKALNLIPQRLLSLCLAAYQSYLRNRIVAVFLTQVYREGGVAVVQVCIAGEDLPIHACLDERTLAELTALRVAMPYHRASFRPAAVADIAQRVLADEGLVLDDLKARILSKAYLSRGSRAVLVVPQEMEVGVPGEDERFPGRMQLSVRFVLPPGSYASLVPKAACAG